MQFESENKVFITGVAVSLLSSNSIIPKPLTRGISYYVISDKLDAFKLATSRVDADNGVAIDLLPTAGVGSLAILSPDAGKFLIPVFELNPFRNAIWFAPPSGIVSNIITGPVDDIRTTQLVFDQNGNNIQTDQLRVYRTDKQTNIVVQDAINTDSQATFSSYD